MWSSPSVVIDSVDKYLGLLGLVAFVSMSLVVLDEIATGSKIEVFFLWEFKAFLFQDELLKKNVIYSPFPMEFND